MPNRLLIVNGILVDPALGLNRPTNLLVEDGVIAAITPTTPVADEVLDARGGFVCPGFVDMHVHLREPGFEHKETVSTGLAGAVRGGFTAVAPMPNTLPVCDSVETLRHVQDRAREAGLAQILPIGSITTGSRGGELSPMEDMVEAGCRAFSNDGQPVDSTPVMLQAMREAASLGVLIVDHCEERSLVQGGVMHPGPAQERFGLPPLGPLAEEVQVARDILLAEESGCPIHIAHLSTERSLDLVRWARRRGAPVTAEAAPHHFVLCDQDIPAGPGGGADPNFKMNPPLRSREDRAAILEGLRDGTIEVIATDHAPHSPDEKAQGFQLAPFGILGLETAVPLVLDQLFHRGILGIEALVRAMAVRPAELMGASPRTLAPGAEANLTLIHPGAETRVRPEAFASRSRNTPFAGWRLRGGVLATVVAGRTVFRGTF